LTKTKQQSPGLMSMPGQSEMLPE